MPRKKNKRKAIQAAKRKKDNKGKRPRVGLIAHHPNSGDVLAMHFLLASSLRFRGNRRTTQEGETP